MATLPVIWLMGPTAAGKTAFALELAQQAPCELISVDSALVYRGMDIGTAKPSAAEQQLAPHRLIDICDPSEPYSAGDFKRDCLAAIDDIHAQGRVPVLVGGTMLYYRALSQFDELPAANSALRAELQALLQQQGLPALVELLRELDPDGVDMVELQNPQRVLRAIEMVKESGRSLRQLWQTKQAQTSATYPWPLLKLVLSPPRDVLKQRIEVRLAQMFSQGFAQEVVNLYQRGDLHMDLPAIRAVGYRQVWQALAGEFDMREAQQRALFATRQLAKRQLTWLRKEPDTHWFNPLDDAELQSMRQLVANFLAKEGICSQIK